MTAHEATGQVPLEGPEGRAPGKHALEDAHQPHSGRAAHFPQLEYVAQVAVTVALHWLEAL